jgi:thiol:disulfide interchange protein
MRFLRVLHTLGVLLICAVWAAAKEDPVQWTLRPVDGYSQVEAGGKVWLELTATVQAGYHLYSPTTPPGGPIVTKIRLVEHPAVADAKLYRPAPVTKRDPNFEIDTETYASKAVFYIEAQTKAGQSGPADLKATTYYQACSDVKCLLPVRKTAVATVTFGGGGGKAGDFKVPLGYSLVPGRVLASESAKEAGGNSSPVPQTNATTTDRSSSRVANTGLSTQQDLLPFLLTAFLFGLAALFTPCVFPMIPITVSFFLNQGGADGENKGRGWKQAALFCIGIIVLFTGLGFLVTAITGPFGVVQLGSSPWVNAFISVIFFVFGLSLLGAFEIRLPSGLLTQLDRASQGGGYVGTLLMGLTFSLTSFACIGPIVGPLLVASVQSKGAQPVLGMASFATGLALPFFFLALFPAYLKKLPRSGGWLARVKVVLGFVVLAAMFKYLSNIDLVLQTHILTRERFLAIWIVLFAMAGLYLLGFLRLEGMTKDEPLGVTRALIAAALLIFAISLVPGLFGARLGELDAYVPEASGSLFAGSAGATTEPANYFKNDLDGALAAARSQNKQLLINFTGYACTNCHWMKANIFSRPEIQAALKDLVVVDLYTDGTDAESQKNAELEDKKFNTASIPFYAIVDADQNVIATFPQLTRNPKEFLSFLGSRPTGKA